MKCPSCSKPLHKGSKFCPHCGAPAPTESPEAPAAKKGGKIALILLAVVIIAALAAANVHQYTAINAAKADYSALEEEYAALEEEYATLEKQKESLQRKINGFQNQLDRTRDATAAYNDLQEFFSSGAAACYNKYKSYYSDTNVIVVQVGETETVSVTSNTWDTIAYERDNDNVSCSWGNRWDYNTATLNITGKEVGTSLLLFTREGDAEEFYVLVIVI